MLSFMFSWNTFQLISLAAKRSIHPIVFTNEICRWNRKYMHAYCIQTQIPNRHRMHNCAIRNQNSYDCTLYILHQRCFLHFCLLSCSKYYNGHMMILNPYITIMKTYCAFQAQIILRQPIGFFVYSWGDHLCAVLTYGLITFGDR